MNKKYGLNGYTETEKYKKELKEWAENIIKKLIDEEIINLNGNKLILNDNENNVTQNRQSGTAILRPNNGADDGTEEEVRKEVDI